MRTFVLAVSFGVLARTLGWGVVALSVFSGIVFSGSAQFAVADVLGAGGSALAAIFAAILAALVLVGTFSEDGRLKVDAQAVGVAVSGGAFMLRLPMLAAIALGAVTTAALRAL